MPYNNLKQSSERFAKWSHRSGSSSLEMTKIKCDMDSLQSQMKDRLLRKDKNKLMNSTQSLTSQYNKTHHLFETKNEGEYQQKAIQNFHMYQIKNKALKIRKSGGSNLAQPLELIPQRTVSWKKANQNSSVQNDYQMHLDIARVQSPNKLQKRRKSTSWSRPRPISKVALMKNIGNAENISNADLMQQRSSYTSIQNLISKKPQSHPLNSDRPTTSSNMYLSKVKDLVHLQTEILSQPSESSIQIKQTYAPPGLIDSSRWKPVLKKNSHRIIGTKQKSSEYMI